MVEAVLRQQTFDVAAATGLDDDDITIEIGLLIHVGDNPIGETTEEVAFAKLNDAIGAINLCSGLAV